MIILDYFKYLESIDTIMKTLLQICVFAIFWIVFMFMENYSSSGSLNW